MLIQAMPLLMQVKPGLLQGATGRPRLEATGLYFLRTEHKGLGQREQQACGAARIVRLAVAERERRRDIGLQVAEKQPRAGACGGQCKAVM
jgi:hypothetical protein